MLIGVEEDDRGELTDDKDPESSGEGIFIFLIGIEKGPMSRSLSVLIRLLPKSNGSGLMSSGLSERRSTELP